MGLRSLSCLAFLGATLTAALVTLVQAGEPTARELVALAPTLDSSAKSCRSLEIRGWGGGDGDLEPKWRFQAVYRAPNQFRLLISDAVDGTPLVFGSGRKMIIYDPVVPTVYYSEAASFTMAMECSHKEFKFNIFYFLKSNIKNHLFIDLNSVLSFRGHGVEGKSLEDRIVKRGPGKFDLIRSFKKIPVLTFNIDLTQACPYTAATFANNGIAYLRLDRLALNVEAPNEMFAFPVKERLNRVLPLKDVTGDEDVAAFVNMSRVVGRATVVRALVNKARPEDQINIRGFEDVNWTHVRDNDKKFAKTLRELVPGG